MLAHARSIAWRRCIGVRQSSTWALQLTQSRGFSKCAVYKQTFDAVPNIPSVQIPEVSPQRVLPIITSRKLQFPSTREPKQAWLESLDSLDEEKLGIIDLHPDIFGAFPRIDMLWWNVIWQQRYKTVDYRKVLTRAEMRGGGKKPWRQKGTGRARHASVRSPIWTKGGAAFGPRGPKPNFFMLPMTHRVMGLTSALSAKFAQENLHIVESLDLPSSDSQYIQDLVEKRGWGLSVLFINDTDMLSENTALALDGIKQYNAMPVYGLNVFSMLKHETLVITLPALEIIEQKLLEKLHAVGPIAKKFRQST